MKHLSAGIGGAHECTFRERLMSFCVTWEARWGCHLLGKGRLTLSLLAPKTCLSELLSSSVSEWRMRAGAPETGRHSREVRRSSKTGVVRQASRAGSTEQPCQEQTGGC